jgi:hypothetical protein
MAYGLTLRRACDRLAPPLQADGAKVRLLHLLGDAGKLDIESAEGKKIGPAFARREGGGKRAVAIA